MKHQTDHEITTNPDHFLPLQVLFDHLADAVYLIESDSANIVWCNASGYRQLGYEPEEVLHHSISNLFGSGSNLMPWDEFKHAVAAPQPHTQTVHFQHKSGNTLVFELNTTYFTYEQKHYFLTVARNTTCVSVLNEQNNDSRNQRIWHVLNQIMDGFWEWEVATNRVFFSARLQLMLGYTADEMEPTLNTWGQVVHVEDLSRVIETLDHHLDDHKTEYEVEYRLRKRNGQYIWVRDKGMAAQRDANDTPVYVIGMLQDITDEKLLQIQLENLAAHDTLTGLPNRREGALIAQNELNFSKRKHMPMCVAVVDFDHFKRVNDTYGHSQGDETIKFLVSVMQSQLRKSDVIYRWGGEEFILLLPDTSIEQGTLVAEKLHVALEHADWEKIAIPRQTVSIGIAHYSGTGNNNIKQLMDEADAALLCAKELGRNRTMLASDMVDPGKTKS